MNKEIDEQWLDWDRTTRLKKQIVAVSNTGKYRRADGTVGILSLRQLVKYGARREYCYRIIAEHFLITVKRTSQDQIDHIQHFPTDYNVNDVRNLRYCTHAENSRFDEARENFSRSHKGLLVGDKNPMYGRTGEMSPMYGKTEEKNPAWKGDNVGPVRKYRRALKLYKSGVISESELQTYRDLWDQYKKEHYNK